jgi:hypothetical protein
MRYVVSIVVAVLLFISSAHACTEGDGLAQDSTYISLLTDYLDAVDVEGDSALYNTQIWIMYPLYASIKQEQRNIFRPVIERLNAINSNNVELGVLRASGTYKGVPVEASLLDSNKSGPDTRLIFPSLISGEYVEGHLNQLQYGTMLSLAMKELVQIEDKCMLFSRIATEFSDVAFPYLLRHLVVPYWEDIEVYHPEQTFTGYEARLDAKLLWETTSGWDSPSTDRAILDHELHLMSIAADLLYIIDNYSDWETKYEVTAGERAVLEDIRATTLSVFQQRLESGSGFLFDVGAWTDDSTFQHALCVDSGSVPSTACPDSNIVLDTSHAQRYPWWVLSFRDSWPIATTNYVYYQNALKGLVTQFMGTMLDFHSSGLPYVKLFMNGSNGWFRVGYLGRPWAFSTYYQSSTTIFGNWYILSDFDQSTNYRMESFITRVCGMIASTEAPAISFRTEYYGDRDATPLYNGAGEIDSMGVGSWYYYYCRVAQELGLCGTM